MLENDLKCCRKDNGFLTQRGHPQRVSTSWGREGVSNNGGKNGQKEGGCSDVCGHPFPCGFWKREEGIKSQFTVIFLC